MPIRKWRSLVWLADELLDRHFDLRRVLSLNILLDALRFFIHAADVGIDCIVVTEIIADGEIHLLQGEGGIHLDNVFRRFALMIGMDDQIEQNASAADAHSALFVDVNRDVFRDGCIHHQRPFAFGLC